jgi:hypothetical protein
MNPLLLCILTMLCVKPFASLHPYDALRETNRMTKLHAKPAKIA